MTGAEMMLRSLGLSEVLDAAKRLAEGGAVEKLLAFVDGIDEHNERLNRIEQTQALIAEKLGVNVPQQIDGTAVVRDVAPGSGSEHRGASVG